MRPERRSDDCGDDHSEVGQLRRIAVALENSHADLHTIKDSLLEAVQILKCQSPAQGPALWPFVAAVYGRSTAMAVSVPVPKLLDTEKIVLSVMPRKADGHVDTGAVVSWASSDPAQVGIEVGVDTFVFSDPQFSEDVTCPGSFNCTALTPLQSGTATVSVSSLGYESADFGPIVYEPGVPRSLNASVGGPISDV